MAPNLTTCLAVGDLERLLAEELRGAERDSVESHVQVCSSCQSQLARLSAPSYPPTPTAFADGADPEPDEAFLGRLRKLSPRTGVADADAVRFPGGRLGRYEILEKLATGGMGAVYKARHIELGKVVALKVLPAGDRSEVSLARFKNEMRAIGRLQHPHIVAAHDAGDIDGVHFLAMDFVDGVDLARLVHEHGRLSVPDACEAIRQAAKGLQQAFEKGLVHRDVKPSNLMLARGGLVLDLGLARADDVTSERLTSPGALLGTADYLAPEQWEHAQSADIRADIYGLGCTLYHLVAGRPPFDDGRNTKILARMRSHQEKPPPSITATRPDVPAGLAGVLNRMLAKVPANRFQTPAEVAEALRPFAAGADLRGLFQATGTWALPPAEAAATPDPAGLDTVSGGRRDRPARGRRRFLIPAVVGVVGLAILAAVVLWPRAKPATASELRVNHARNGTSLGEMRLALDRVRVNDRVSVAADLSAPTYYYLIAFNPDGSEQLCLPADPADQGDSGARPEKLPGVRYPRGQHDFELDAPGLQVFVLVVSARPLPPYAEWRSGCERIPWTAVPNGGNSSWHFDGEEFTRFRAEERGKIVPRDGAPAAVRDLCAFFKGREEFDAVRVFAFPVENGR